MRRVNSWEDLSQFGIIPLTGEACGFCMRLLCDVTPAGVKTIERFLGGTVDVRKDSNWNSRDGAVGSVMLPRSIFGDLAAFCLLTTGTAGVVTMGDGTVRELDQEHYERYQKLDADRAAVEGSAFPQMLKRTWRRSTDPGTGDRNTHAMSGRTE